MRDVYFVHSTSRMQELRAEFEAAQADPFVGVSFFQSTHQPSQNPGLTVGCNPVFLRSSLLQLVASGSLNPTDSEPFLFCNSNQKFISRWIMSGVHDFNPLEQGQETLGGLIFRRFEALLANVSGLRPYASVFCIDSAMWLQYAAQLFPHKSPHTRQLILSEILRWFFNESTLEKSVIWCNSNLDYTFMLQQSRLLRSGTGLNLKI